jgi:hypothetical protein
MSLRKTLSAFVSAIVEETEKNASFRVNVERALGINVRADVPEARAAGTAKKKGGRRTPAVFDPVEVAREGESALRARVGALTLEQLRDIVAQYGMDPGKLVMKWKDSNRVIDRIVELALARAAKGDAFRD